MKKLAILIVVLSLTASACDAFKDTYDGVNVPVTGTEGTASANTASGGTTEDGVICEALKDVAVTMSEDQGAVTSTVIATAADPAKLRTVAEKIDDTATRITVTEADRSVVSFVLKKKDDKTIVACSVTADGMKIKKGTITVDSFNLAKKGDDKAIVNSGSFNLVFDKEVPADAAKIMAEMAADTVADTAVIEGSYYTDTLTETKVKKEETEK